VKVENNGYSLNGGGRIYFSEKASDDFSPDMYWQVPLKNHSFSYDVNLSKVACGCNAAAYFSNMPTYDAQGNIAKGGKTGDYYCDANYPENLCPEMDTFEGNMHTFAVTPHTC
jgi:cellulose 1,4-beta-cellobiosidase